MESAREEPQAPRSQQEKLNVKASAATPRRDVALRLHWATDLFRESRFMIYAPGGYSHYILRPGNSSITFPLSNSLRNMILLNQDRTAASSLMCQTNRRSRPGQKFITLRKALTSAQRFPTCLIPLYPYTLYAGRATCLFYLQYPRIQGRKAYSCAIRNPACHWPN